MPSNQSNINIGVKYNVDQASVNAVKKSLQDLQNIKIKDFSGTKKQLDQIKTTAKQVESALQQAFNVNLGSLNVSSFNDQLRSAGLSINQIYTQFSQAGAAGTNAFRSMASSVLTTNLQLKQTKSLITSMGETMANTVKWGIASSVMNSFTNSVKQAFQYAQSLDSALTDIRIVTGDSTQQMKQFAAEANKAAQTLGRSTMDYTKAALTFYQQGLSDEEVKTRTQTVLKAQNITGAGQEMANYLTAVWNGYKVANQEAELYVDKLAAVADSSASNMSQLAVAMSKVASAANNLGVPVDSLNAQIATITATTRQAPETVGNALKTIYARINDIKTGSDDAEVSLGNYSKQMAQLGFNVLDASGNLRDTGDVLEQIGGKWETLSRQQQIYLARTMAGQRQYNNLVSLFDNWGKYTDLLNVSMEAQGTTMEKNSRYIDSLEAKLEQLGAASQRVKAALINEQDIKGLTQLGTGIVNLFGSFVESIGGGRGALLGLTGVITSVFGPTISKQLGAIINNFQQAKNNAAQLQQQIEQTRQFSVSKGYNEGITTELVNSLKEGQQYYSAMSNQQIQSYNNTIRQIAANQNLVDQLKEEEKTLQGFNDSITKAGQAFSNDFEKQVEAALEVTRDLGNQLQDLSLKDLQDPQIFGQLVRQVEQLEITVGTDAVPAFQHFRDILNQIQTQNAPATSNQLAQLRAMARAALQQTNNLLGKDIDQIKAKTSQATSELTRLKQERDAALSQAKNNSISQNLTAYVSSLTQILSVINNISRISSIWQNDSLSQGQKIRQTLTNVVFSLGMALSAYNKITTAMGIQHLSAEKRWLTQHKITLEKEKQLLLETKSALAGSRPIGNRSNGNKQFLEWFKQVRQVDQQIVDIDNQISNTGNKITGLGSTGSLVVGKLSSAFTSLGTILSGPVGIAAGVIALTTLIGVGLYKAYNKARDAAREAEKVRAESKQQYDSIKESVDDLNSSLDNLASARQNLDSLSEGTKQWNSALQDVNQQVLDLIEKFPQLKGYLESNNGILGFKQGAQEYIQNIYRQRQFASGLTYAATDRQSTQATNRSLIVDASRNLFGNQLGLVGLSADSLQEVVNAIHQHGDWILENSQTLSDFTSLEEREIDAVIAHREAVNELAIQTQNNTIASQNLTNAIIENQLSNVSQYQNSSNKQLFAAMVEDVYKNATLSQDYYRTVSYRSTGSEQSVLDQKALAQRWAESLGQVYGQTIKVNVFGKIQRQIDGQWKTVSQSMVETAVAQYDALQNIDDYYTTITNTINNLGDRGSEIYSAFLNGTVGSQLSQDDIQYIKQNRDKFTSQILHTLFGDNDYDQELNKYSQDIQKNIQKYVDNFPTSVKNAFNTITSGRQDSISAEATQAIGSILIKAFGQGGNQILTLFKDIFKGVKTQDLLPFEQLISNIGANTSLEEFKILAADAGIQLDNSNPKLASFVEYLNSIAEAEIPNPEQFYKSIHDIIDGIKIGDTITAEQGAVLEQAGIQLSKYFDRFPDGTLKLRQSVEQFVNEANNISLQPLIDKLNSLSEQVALRSNFENSKYSASNGQDFQSFSSSAQGAQQLSAQLAFLQAIDQLTPQITAKVRDLSQQQVNWNNLTEEQKNLLNEVAEQVQLNHGRWLDNASAIDEASNNIDRYAQQLGNATKTLETLDQDVNQDQWKDLSQYLRDYATVLDEVSADVQDNAEISDQLAESLLRYDNALAEVIQHEDQWGEMLSSGAMQDRIEAGNELQNVYADLLDLPFESLSPDFTQDINNFNKLKQAVNGSEEAYNQLMQLAQQDIQAQANITMDDTEFWNAKSQVQTAMDEMNFEDIEIGASLNDEGFLNALTEMVNAAGMTAEQATDYLASMGIDAEVTENNSPTTQQKQTSGWTTTLQPVTQIGTVPVMSGLLPIQVPITYRTYQAVYTPQMEQITTTSDNKAVSLKVTSAHKSSGGGFKHKNASHGGGSRAPKSSGKKGGGGGGGGKGKAATPSTAAKLNTSTIDTKAKKADTNPYQQEQKSYDRQSKKLDQLQDKQKKLVNKDRLKNLQQQNKVLEKQKEILEKELDISNIGAAENSTANYAERLAQAFGDAFRLDTDGQIANQNKLLEQNAAQYNRTAQAAADAFEKEKALYNDYIQNTWNKYATKDQQEAHKAQKQRWDQRIKNAEQAAKKQISSAEEVYKQNEKLIDLYNKAWEQDQKRREQIEKAQQQIYDNMVQISQIKVGLSIDTGDLERDWLKFENKFIKKLDKDDFLGNAKASAKELMSYFNSGQISNINNQITSLQDTIKRLQKMQVGAVDKSTGYDLAKAQERLSELLEMQQDKLMEIQDLVDDIKEKYLDAIDDAKDKMDDQIDQYQRINDLVQHNVKMTQLLFGDKAYDTLDKYYELQQKNNQQELDSLRRQQDYWQKKMDNQVVGSDAWKKFKENLDDTVDQLNSKLEDMIDNLHTKWANKVDGIIQKMNNALTGGRGLDYLDQQWDAINNYDDKFLDTFESKTGIDQVERLYQSTIDSMAGSPKAQQKLNQLMNDQMKLLREKDHLTQYDLERAKASLEVEKARLALEEARDNRTKMRLRRDSQGNYTYQYVADEEKLGDLQAALADAQANLYNTDKEHYKQNLNDLYDTYKNYIQQMRDLTEEYNNTQDEEERKRIQNRIDLLKKSTSELMEGLTQDNKQLLQYLNESFFDGMNIDTSMLTMEQQMEILQSNVPQMQSQIQDLANTIVGQGGILNATADMIKEINAATKQYDEDVKNTLATAGTSVSEIAKAIDSEGQALDRNVQNAKDLVTANDQLIKSCNAQISAMEKMLSYMDQYLNKVLEVQTVIGNLRSSYNSLQNLNGSNLTADKINVADYGLDTTFNMNYTGNPATDAATVKKQIDALMSQYEKFLAQMSIATFDTGGYTGTWGDAEGRLAFLHQNELVLNQEDTRNILEAVYAVRNMTSLLNSIAQKEIASITDATGGVLSDLNTTMQLDQNVHIEANFPNVTQHTEIEQAFQNLVNMASMRASRYRD